MISVMRVCADFRVSAHGLELDRTKMYASGGGIFKAKKVMF